MTPEKHAPCIKPLSIGRAPIAERDPALRESAGIGPGGAETEVRLNGRDHLDGMELNMVLETHAHPGDWHAEARSHSHPYPECLFFVGLDTANIRYLGAAIEILLGEEREVYAFDEPTVVIIPAGMPHGPITTKRVFSPRGFGFISAAPQAVPDIRWDVTAENTSRPTRKYASLIKPLESGLLTERRELVRSRFSAEELAEREAMQRRTGFRPGPGSPDHMAWMYGRDLGNMAINVAWGFASSPGISQRGVDAHSHPEDEILIYLGTEREDPDCLGAEIEIDLGQEHKRHIFNRSSVILCPAGIPHGPIVTRWVDRPFAFLLVNLAGEVSMSFE